MNSTSKRPSGLPTRIIGTVDSRLTGANCGTSDYAIYQMPPEQCSPPTAIPGRSKHEQGLAVDFTIGGQTLRTSDGAYRWMVANAASYGFPNTHSPRGLLTIFGSGLGLTLRDYEGAMSTLCAEHGVRLLAYGADAWANLDKPATGG